MIGAAFAILIILLLAIYVSGYFIACEDVVRIRVLGTSEKRLVRLYHAEWIAVIFRPVAYVESVLTQKVVTTEVWVIAN